MPNRISVSDGQGIREWAEVPVKELYERAAGKRAGRQRGMICRSLPHQPQQQPTHHHVSVTQRSLAEELDL